MQNLLEIAVVRRAAMVAELRELDEFVERAQDLLAGRRRRPAAERTRAAAVAGSNVLIFRRRVRPAAGPAATGDGIGA